MLLQNQFWCLSSWSFVKLHSRHPGFSQGKVATSNPFGGRRQRTLAEACRSQNARLLFSAPPGTQLGWGFFFKRSLAGMFRTTHEWLVSRCGKDKVPILSGQSIGWGCHQWKWTLATKPHVSNSVWHVWFNAVYFRIANVTWHKQKYL